MEKITNLIKPFLENSLKFTNADNEIVNFINSYEGDNFNLSQKELAKITNTSEGSVSRFVKKLGFKNYRDFYGNMNNIIGEFSKNFINRDYIKSENASKDILLFHKFALDEMISRNFTPEIAEISNLIHISEKIYILALGSSQKSAMELNANLLKIGKSSFVCSDFYTFIPILGNLSPDDLLLTISDQFKNDDIIFGINVAKSYNAKIAIITSNPLVANKYKVNAKMVYKKVESPYKSVPTSSKLSQIIICDLIFDMLIQNHRIYQERLQRTKNVLDAWIRRKLNFKIVNEN
ncbi:MurR/RpiR family transcriptional regulator [Mycoplasmopsis caviae]|uniref:GntR family transcriptional regulator n=1 Tax=Mycoplasmopsis caviae TaxID=55603 RepID=A0A3P8MDG4_9BACT|nr:MurR/RpiR family transcriptional regulator [Mycoplasmopsis caviae]UUD35433.1 MurR/RpiR family transcriptional regulator [Mycoplasmopsis caviae]VDR41790.1 GntR family transcriptional regulator [Mycoplasmopsis caviae]